MACPGISTGLPPRRTGRRNVVRRRVFSVTFLLLASLSLLCHAQSSPLPPDKAFRFTARALNPQTVEAKFNIADGYYLYRDKVHFVVEPNTAVQGSPQLPAGKVKQDDFFGQVETYRGSVIVNIDLQGTAPGQQLTVEAQSQGCADVGICYPPTIQRVTLSLPAANAGPSAPVEPVKKSWFN
jgi:thiol:disulfide interchange protein DsbD